MHIEYGPVVTGVSMQYKAVPMLNIIFHYLKYKLRMNEPMFNDHNNNFSVLFWSITLNDEIISSLTQDQMSLSTTAIIFI